MRRTDITSRKGSQRGFTIVELVVVIGIIVIVVAIATPNMTRYLRQSRLKEVARTVEGGIEQVRNTARTRQEPNIVTLVTANRIFSFVDNVPPGAATGNRIFDAGEAVILDDRFTGGVTLAITSTTPGAVAPFGTVPFNALGNITDTNNRVITVSMEAEPLRRFQITIYSTGSTRVMRSEDAGATWLTRAW